MKVVILAGGLGTRLMEETVARPKPMVEVGGRPILWHIMRLYAAQGFDDFIVAAGYKGAAIRDYFRRYRLLDGNLRLDFASGEADAASGRGVNWDVEVVDTGEATLTGGRLQRLATQLKDTGTFMVTYGDGLADVDLEALLAFHRGHGRLATLTAVHPPAQTQVLAVGGRRVDGFCEPETTGWINGGFFVFEPQVFDYLGGDTDTLEARALTQLADGGELMAYRHDGFWQCMDTIPERNLLESLWLSGAAPWLRPRKAALV